MVYGITDARHRGQMNHRIERLSVVEALHSICIADVCAAELESARVPGPFDLGNVRLFTRDVVIRIEIVDPHDLVTFSQQSIGDMTADEPGRAC